MLQQHWFSLCDVTQETIHLEMELRIIILHCSIKPVNGYPNVEFLADFPYKSLFGSLSGFYFSARKFPPALPVAITSLGGEYLTIFFDNSSNYSLSHL